MSRTVIEARIQDRTARSRLKPRNKPYWRCLSEGVHLGYRRGVLKGTWVARYLCKQTDAYVTNAIGEADDRRTADGIAILSYKQAFDAALVWLDQCVSGVPEGADPEITVAEAIETYIATRNARRSVQAGRSVKSDAESNLTRSVLKDRKLPQIRLSDLAESDLRAWQLRLPPWKPTTVKRIASDFKAALNMAFAANRRVLPADLPTVIKFGLKVDTVEMLTPDHRENQILTDEEVRRVVAAALAIDSDFGQLVVLLAATGARFSQLARMTVRDVQWGQSRVMIPQSFKGKKRVITYTRVAVGADTLGAIRSAVEDRPPSAPLLERWRHKQVGPMDWVRVERGPWTSSSEMLRMWKKAANDAGLPATTIPYALRHSSIVRGLRVGLPIRLVAAIHDTSVQMIERHYSRWITEGLDEMAARAVVPIVSQAA